MSKSSFYSGSGLTNTEQDAIEGAKNAAEAARDAAQAAQTAAETARDSAQSSSSTASGHAATATTKADEASGSANTANNHASTATTKADEASTSASNAADDADDAQKLAINAEDSQFTLSDGSTTGYSALHHKEKALDAQTAAESAKTAAETAKTSAETAQTAAEAALADFEGVYLGPHASDPTQDANGDNVGAGDLYFNTADSELLVYNGTNWVTSGVTTTATTSDNGLMSSSDKTKLDGIEASADVTDAANVDPLVDTHLNTSTANSGEYLKWTGTDYDWASVPPGYADSDVDTHLNVSGASSGQFLKYNGSDYAWDDVDLSSKLSLTGGTMTGAIRLDDTNIIFDDTSGYSLTLKATSTATSNKTISLPNATGTVALATTTTNFSALQRFSSGLMLDSFEYLHWGNDEEAAAITGSYLSNSLTFSTDNVSRVQINNSGLYLYAGGTLRFEGANANNHETTLTVTDPTNDREISLPDSSGTVLLTDGDGSSLTNVAASTVYVTESSDDNVAYNILFSDTSGSANAQMSPQQDDGALTFNPLYNRLYTGSIHLSGSSTYDNKIIFEGATDDDYETSLTSVDATADRTITLPDASGDVLLSNTNGGTQSFILSGVNSTTGVESYLDVGAIGSNYLIPSVNRAQIYALSTDVAGTDYADLYLKSGSLIKLENTTSVNGDLRLEEDHVLIFEGATDDNYEITLTVDDPTADREISLPDKDGEVVVANDGDISLISYSNAFFGPVLEIFHDSTSPADSDKAGSISWYARSSIGNKSGVATIQAASDSVYSSGITGELIFYTQAGAASDSRLRINSSEILAQENIKLDTGHTLIFEGATNDDFQTTLTVVDATADRTISLPDASGTVLTKDSNNRHDGQLVLGNTDPAQTPSEFSDDFVISGSHHCGFTIASDSSTASQRIGFADADSNGAGSIWYQHNGDVMSFYAASAGNPQFRITSNELMVGHNVSLNFEGSTNDTNELILTVADPTADQTVTIPDQTGTLMLWQSAWPDDPAFENIAIGDSALSSASSTGVQNIAIGPSAATALTSADYCTAIGYNAMRNNTTDSYTTAVGWNSGGGDLLTGGTYLGAYAGDYLFSSKDYQVALGYFAMNDCSGDNSVAIGALAMSDGNHANSIAIGYNALGRSSTSNPYYNVAVGYNAGDGLYSGDYNTYCGYDTETYYNNTSNATVIGAQARVGYYHGVSVGYRAGYSMSAQSDYCTLVGNYAGYDLDAGDRCTFIGYSSGYSGGSGNHNTGTGMQSVYSLNGGNYNSGFGYQAAYHVSSGDYNTAVGGFAATGLNTGSNNTCLGYATGSNTMLTNSNCTVIGANADPSSNSVANEITLGDTNITSLRCNVQTISSLSDERDKTAIEDLSYGLDFINDMRPVQFTWNRRDGSLGATKDMGFIAQDLYDVELDHSSTSRTRLVNWEDPSKLEADYVRSYPILVKAVQELSAKVDALTARVAELEGV